MEPDELTEEETLRDAFLASPGSLALLEQLAGETVSLDELLELSEENDEPCE
jgi:hypothetical protein